MLKVINQHMTPENFCYWLQGLLELQPGLHSLDAEQVKMVREHLAYVFQHGHLPSQATTTITETPTGPGADVWPGGSLSGGNSPFDVRTVSIC